jgi:hypothetical protein
MKNAMTMILLAVAITLSLCGGAWAEQTWLCSIGSAVAVDEDGTVGPPDLGEKERPTFFRVDAAKKELTLLSPASRRGEVTKIDMVHESQGQRIFSGVENGRSLNLIIADDGRMSLSVLGDGVVWSVFGNALPEGEIKAAPKGEAHMLPAGESKAASEGVTKAQSVELDGSTAAFEPCICPSEDVGVATSVARTTAFTQQRTRDITRCKLARRK